MRLSLRIEQITAFIVVILVAMLVLSTWMMGDLNQSVHEMARSEQIKDASAVASGLGPYFPPSAASTVAMRDRVARYVDILGDDVMVFDGSGALIAGARSLEVPRSVIASARVQGFADAAPYSSISFNNPSYVVASKAIYDEAGRRAGVVVVANSGATAQAALDNANNQLTIALALALLTAGLLGIAFSEIITRQTRALVDAANAVAEGDFSRRLPRGLLPDEIRDLVDAFNRMAGQLGEAFDALKGQEEAQREFVASASHELRTPVAALKGAIEILQDGAGDKPAVRERFLSTMQLEVDRMQRLVDHLFTLAQVDAGRLDLHMRSEDVGAIVGVVAASLAPLAEEARVAIRSEVEADGLFALCDRDRITQVLMAMADNAIKHSGPGDAVTLSAVRSGDGVEVSVADTGTGIPPEALPRIFDRFFTDRAAEAGRRRGSGLGLSIASEIVEAHGGRITVESAMGAGTTFRFTLETAPPQAPVRV
jgi:two-component system OmpR family sensor kinase